MIGIDAKGAGRCLGLATAVLLVAATAGQAADVRVHRGSQVTVESAKLQRAKSGQKVAVQRGHVAATETAGARQAAKAPRITVNGGEEVWLVDRKTGKLIGCELRKTSTVGRNRIVCARRSLSRILH